MSDGTGQMENVLQWSVAPNEALMPEALEARRMVTTSTSTVAAGADKGPRRSTAITGSLVATVVDIEIFEGDSAEEYRGMSIVATLHSAEKPVGPQPSTSAFTLTPSQPRVMPVGAAYADASLQMAVHRGTSSAVGSIMWGSVTIPLVNLNDERQPPQGQVRTQPARVGARPAPEVDECPWHRERGDRSTHRVRETLLHSGLC